MCTTVQQATAEPISSRSEMANTLNVALQNQTSSRTVYAYITGQAINNGNALFLLQSDGVTPYYPSSPATTGSPIPVNCAIPLGSPGSTTNCVIPQIAGGRIWFSIDNPLVFLINPGPALVEPSVTNPADANINTRWDFCEFTFNSTQLYANITRVDFVCLPISLALTNNSGVKQQVQGIPADGLNTICMGLMAQNAIDGAGWNQLIVSSGGEFLRALSPNNGIIMNDSLFSGYFDPYVDKVWKKYSDTVLTIDTQASWGVVTGQVINDVLTYNGFGGFARPASRDIFSCSTGPFAVSSAAMGALAARLSAAFNRSTLLTDSTQPSSNISQYYQDPITNHYSRIVHSASPGGRGYAFPYDDVRTASSNDQSGSVNDPNPSLLTVILGGGNTLSAFSIIQAAAYTTQNDTQTQTTADVGGGLNVGWIHDGSWLAYAGVDFGSQGATQFTARVACGASIGVSGLVQVVLDAPGGQPVGSLAVANTGGWQSWITAPTNITTITGIHMVYLVFSSGQSADFVNLHWFTFS